MAKRHVVAVVGALLLASVAGCATPPDRSDAAAYAEFRAINDPFEPLNRQIFGFNQAFDTMALRPAAIFYKEIIPPPFQRTRRRSTLPILRTIDSRSILARQCGLSSTATVLSHLTLGFPVSSIRVSGS